MRYNRSFELKLSKSQFISDCSDTSPFRGQMERISGLTVANVDTNVLFIAANYSAKMSSRLVLLTTPWHC